jgi:hypothetical protein
MQQVNQTTNANLVNIMQTMQENNQKLAEKI